VASRGWGFWTEAKLDILSKYLHAFTTASKSAGKCVYLDLFAGSESNHRRDTGEDIAGSAIRALQTEPEFDRLVLLELPDVAKALEGSLREQFPSRSLDVVAGNCNDTLAAALDRLRAADLAWAPTFAFIDPYATTALQWETLASLADFKRDRRYKVELWLNFSGSAIPRLVGLADKAQDARITAMFGSDDWRRIADAREERALEAEAARYEYTNLMRWRIERVLGYERTHSLEIKNTSGVYLYDLIFATDNAVGDRIMSDVYNAALAQNERMRQDALERRRESRTGESRLFDLGDIRSTSDTDLRYVHEPPERPYGSRQHEKPR
jgi:three-Cys-motif partner protein